ncbi:hypothetical protein [Devosia sp. 2618]|uniref:hypothetical protein n=1 Tax=Devosia sp. 2618 TaxID=3156454 RepID=UPI00339B5962
MSRTKLLLLATVATGVMLQPAMALDAQSFVDRVAAVYKTMGYDLEFGPATLDGDTITVDGLTASIPSTPEAPMEPMVLDTEITFSGVTENGDGSYFADSVTIPDIDTEFTAEPVGHLSLSDIRVDGFYVPAGNPPSAVGLLQLYQSFSTGPLSVTRDGVEVVSFDSVTSESKFNPEFGSAALTDLTSTFEVSGITVDLTSLREEEPDAADTIDALGLTTVNGDISMDMAWSMSDGHIQINQFLLDFADVGSLDIALDITGFTPAVLDQIYAMQAKMAAAGEPTQEQAQAQMMQGMALLQGVSIVGASVRYDDASLAGKALDSVAKDNGTDRANFVAGLKAMLPSVIASSGIPALNDIVVPPVSAFLDNPQSLEVKLAPPSPTSLLVLMAAAANPAGLITALGLAVEANTAK